MGNQNHFDNGTRTGNSFGGLDLFRLIAAFLVVAIHTSPLMSFSAEADFFLTRVLARIAVPFFFMVTGQFVLAKHPGRDFPVILAYLKKIGLLYLIAILIYLPAGIYAGHYKAITPADALRMLVFDGTFYHLWYFPACILGVLMVWLLAKYLSDGTMTIIATVLYALGLFGDSYYGLIADLPVLSDVYEFGFQLFSHTRNGLFFAPLFLILGMGMHGSAGRPASSRASDVTGLVISFLLLTGEAFLLRHFELQRHDSMYFFLVPCMFFLYRLLLRVRLKNCKTLSELRSISTWIYLLHPAMIVLIRGLAKPLHLTKLLVENSLIHYLAVNTASFLASLGILLLKRLFLEYRRHLGHDEPFRQGRAWIELDREALRKNVAALTACLPEGCKLMPAIKANAYGHGSLRMARELSRLGVDSFCVASVDEGVELRKGSIRGEILVLGYTHPDQFHLLHRYHLTQTVIDYEYALRLNKYGQSLPVHVGVDTGMHRLGEPCENLKNLRQIFAMKNLTVEGLFTHLSASDSLTPQAKDFTNAQADAFYDLVSELERAGFPRPKLHLLASYGILNYPRLAEDYVRVGIALYGVLSTKDDTACCPIPLQPVLSLKARVASVKKLKPGESAGYGMAFTAVQPMRIAVLTIGYADGLPRALSVGAGKVLFGGHSAPIIGRICMDQTLVDITDIPGVSPGSTATLIGRSGDAVITACDLAEEAGTITNEILSRLGARLARIIV